VKFKNILNSVYNFFKKLFKNSIENDLMGISAEISYYIVFSLFPLTIFFVASLSLFARNTNFYLNLVSLLYSNFPPKIAELLNSNLKQLAENYLSTSALLISSLITLWISSKVIMAFIKGINRTYMIEETRTYVQRLRLSVSLIFSIGFLLLIASGLIMFGEDFTEWYTHTDSLVLPDDISTRLNIIRWIFISIILFSLSSLLYFKSPNLKHKFIEVLPGSIFFSIIWSLFTTIFGYYLNNIGNYDLTYGALSTMVILLLWFFLTALIFMLGAQVNATLHPYTEKKLTYELKRLLSLIKGKFIRTRTKRKKY